MSSILREKIWYVERREAAGDMDIFKASRRRHRPNLPRPSGLKRHARLTATNARKGRQPSLALVCRHTAMSFQTELHEINGS